VGKNLQSFSLRIESGSLKTSLSRPLLTLLLLVSSVATPTVAQEGRISVSVAPVFDVYRYGATQARLGAAYDFSVATRWRLGFPLGYTFGGGFSSLQAGVQISAEIARWRRVDLYQRTGVLFERYWGNDRSFLAGTVDLGLGARYMLSRGIWVGLEPVSLEVMPLATEGVPWNVRGQVRIDVGGAW
jgi:hypothetical protein